MFDPERLLGQMLGGALGGALGGKTARRRGGMGVGNKAVLGVGLLGVAMAAWEHYSAKNASAGSAPGTATPLPPPQPLMSAPPPPPPPVAAVAATRPVPMLDLRRQQALLLIRSMIAAAAADGAIDATERQAILERARALGDDQEALAFLEHELAAPSSLADLLAQTPRSIAEDVYAAAALAIAIDTEQERAWLQQLATGLGLDPARTDALHHQLGLG